MYSYFVSYLPDVDLKRNICMHIAPPGVRSVGLHKYSASERFVYELDPAAGVDPQMIEEICAGYYTVYT